MFHQHRNRLRLLCLFLALCLVLPLAGCKDDKTPVQTESGLPEDSTPVESFSEEDITDEPEDTKEYVETTVPPPVTVDDLGGFAVSTSTSEATQVGMQILSSGGNAVDAAVAISFLLSVSEPYSSGIGGGGIMVIYDSKTGVAKTLNYYPCAGSAAANTDKVGVPGMVAGMEKAVKKWGSMPLADLIQPAVDYAEQGFVVSDTFIDWMNYDDSLQNNPAFRGLREGDTLKQMELAKTFRAIQEQGADVFYRGYIAQDIDAACSLTAEDLAAYKARTYQVVESTFSGWNIYGAYAPSSALTVCQMLKVAEMLNIPSPEEDPEGYLAALKTATTVAYRSRTSRVVDPKFYSFKPRKALSSEYLQGKIDTLNSSAWVDDPEKICTTQFSVIDSSGLVVCVTNSLQRSWGSYRCVDGFYLNYTLDNFSNSGKNAYEPGKQPRTGFSPMICVGPEGQILAIGTPGGNEIPKLLTTVLIDILREGTDVQTAVDKSRIVFQTNGILQYEYEDVNPLVVDISSYDAKGVIFEHKIFGCTSIVGYDPVTGVYAISDKRRETSTAMVYQFNS